MLKSISLCFRGKAHQSALILLLLLPWTLGCGGEEGPLRAEARGAVSLDGQPLAEGVICFIPSGDTKGPAAITAVKEGAYEFTRDEGPLAGSHRVEIEAAPHYGFAIDDEAAFVENVEKKGARLPPNPIPDVYNRRSTLSAEVALEAPNELNFQLSSQGRQTAQR